MEAVALGLVWWKGQDFSCIARTPRHWCRRLWRRSNASIRQKWSIGRQSVQDASN
jgi:hypothetical protein